MRRLPNLLARCTAIALLAIALLMSPGVAVADCEQETSASAKTEAEMPADTAGKEEQIVKEAVDNSKRDPETGQREAATGGAKPAETWMACKPGDPSDQCTDKGLSEKGKEQAARNETKTDAEAKISGEVGAASSEGDCADKAPS